MDNPSKSPVKSPEDTVRTRGARIWAAYGRGRRAAGRSRRARSAFSDGTRIVRRASIRGYQGAASVRMLMSSHPAPRYELEARCSSRPVCIAAAR
ncbi:hypothetical protein AURDEDRAFT_172728 [Auricularia subglabra TFB-10046 SS5]|nr:hypothetical protein AURDEDRAFT_172728 [Auricularia subglabra TFB-10046 SS5]